MKYLAFLIITVIGIIIPSLGTTGTKIEVNTPINLTLSATSVRDKVEVRLLCSDYPNLMPFWKAWRWGAEKTNPRYVISDLEVKIGANQIFVPVSAFMDLANPREARIENLGKKGFKLSIIGGDAATSYNAVLTFVDGVLQKKKVSHGAFSDEAWELTTYSFTK